MIRSYLNYILNFIPNDKKVFFFIFNILFFVLISGFYRPRKLGHSFPRLYDIVEGETMAQALLQLNPDDRIGAEEALTHPYFAPLPKKLYELPDGNYKHIFKFFSISFNYFFFTETSIFSVEGVYLYPEPNRQNK